MNNKIIRPFTKYIMMFLLIVVVASVPLLVKDQYFLHMLILVGVYIILALSLNLIVGYTGQLSLGHAAFYGIGAYASALLAMELKFSFIPTLLFAGISAAFIGFVLGVPSLRLRGPYFAIATLGFGEITRYVFLNWVDFTGGPMGLRGIPHPIIRIPGLLTLEISSKSQYYYLVLILIILTIYVSYRIANSGFGRSLIAIREDETLAGCIGIYTSKYKILAFALGTFFAGIAGCYYAHYICFISPDTFTLNESITILVLLLVGGKGTIGGPVLGAIIFTILSELLRPLKEFRLVIYSGILILSIMFMKEGLLGIAKEVLGNFTEKGEEIGKNGGVVSN